MKRALSLFILINVFFIHFTFASNTILALVNGTPISSLSIDLGLLNAQSNEEKTNILRVVQIQNFNLFEYNVTTNLESCRRGSS